MFDFSPAFVQILKANLAVLLTLQDEITSDAPASMLVDGKHYPALDEFINETFTIMAEGVNDSILDGESQDAAMLGFMHIALEAMFCVGYRAGQQGVEMVPCPGTHNSEMDAHRPPPGMERNN